MKYAEFKEIYEKLIEPEPCYWDIDQRQENSRKFEQLVRRHPWHHMRWLRERPKQTWEDDYPYHREKP